MSVYLEIVSATDKVKKLNFHLFGPKNPSEGKRFSEMSFKASVYFLPKNYIHPNSSNWACCNSHEHLNLVYTKVLKL